MTVPGSRLRRVPDSGGARHGPRRTPRLRNSRTLLEMFIAPIHFRLLMTGEPLGSHFLDLIANIAVAGISAAHPA